MLKQRKQPLRKCTGCGETKDKREMIRVVKSSDGEVGLDFTSDTEKGTKKVALIVVISVYLQ